MKKSTLPSGISPTNASPVTASSCLPDDCRGCSYPASSKERAVLRAHSLIAPDRPKRFRGERSKLSIIPSEEALDGGASSSQRRGDQQDIAPDSALRSILIRVLASGIQASEFDEIVLQTMDNTTLVQLANGQLAEEARPNTAVLLDQAAACRAQLWKTYTSAWWIVSPLATATIDRYTYQELEEYVKSARKLMSTLTLLGSP